MTQVPGGGLGLLIMLAGLASPALFVVMLRRVITGFRTGEIVFKARLDGKSESAVDYWASMFVMCIGSVATCAIALVFFSLSLTLIRQYLAG